MNTTFSNWYGNLYPENATQAYPNSFPGVSNLAQSGATEKNTLGYFFVTQFGNRDLDSVYHLTYTFAHTGSSLELDFNGMQNEVINESWGLDNVRVTAN